MITGGHAVCGVIKTSSIGSNPYFTRFLNIQGPYVHRKRKIFDPFPVGRNIENSLLFHSDPNGTIGVACYLCDRLVYEFSGLGFEYKMSEVIGWWIITIQTGICTYPYQSLLVFI